MHIIEEFVVLGKGIEPRQKLKSIGGKAAII
jgi:hypothetical protein